MAYTTQDINKFYNQYLGRDLENPGEAQGWLQNPDAERMIRESGEGQAYTTRQNLNSAVNPWTGQVQDLTAWNAQRDGTTTAPTTQNVDRKLAVPINTAPSNPYAGQADTFLRWIANYTGQQAGGSVTMPGQSYRGNLQPIVDAYNKSMGANARVAGGDKIDFGDGLGPVDVIADVGGRDEWWYGNERAPYGLGGPGPSGGGAGGGGGGGAGGFGVGGMSAVPQGQRDELYNMLMGRAKQGLNINQTNPMIRQQADPYAAQVEREKRLYLDQLAERQGPLANLQGETRLASERAGQATGLFESQLIGRELQSRRDEIAQALQSMQGMLSQEQQLAMQRELAQLDASIRNRQISSDQEQFMGQLGLQAEQQGNYWDALRSGLL